MIPTDGIYNEAEPAAKGKMILLKEWCISETKMASCTDNEHEMILVNGIYGMGIEMVKSLDGRKERTEPKLCRE
jgi:hypothetical protein